MGFAVYIDSTLNRVDALPGYPGRVADTPGTNWLIVGSDSRAGLTPEQQAELVTGDEAAAGGQRTDTIMLLHIPDTSDPPTLVSLPRDSAVPIPGNGRNKINAAFAIGGAPLLAQTVETITGVHIDHYIEVGFGGFAGIVDNIGGVQLCPAEPVSDPGIGLELAPGCQEVNGPTALSYVRTRNSPNGDLDRVQRQREFVGALVGRVASPGVLLNPFRSVPLLSGLSETLIIGNGDHIWHLAGLAWAMRGLSNGGAVTTTVPIAGFEQLDDGSSAVSWNRDLALAMFTALAEDRPVPREAITGPG